MDQTLLQISLITDKQTTRGKGECASICKCIGNCVVAVAVAVAVAAAAAVAVAVVVVIIIIIPKHNRSFGLASLLFHTGLTLILYCNIAS